jgi:hypothetical protein
VDPYSKCNNTALFGEEVEATGDVPTFLLTETRNVDEISEA